MKIGSIKFKAKRLDNGEWVYGSLIRSTAGVKERAYIVDSFSSMSDYSVIGVDPSTVYQFTGLKDCEGNEIWEGDLLQSEESERIYEVVWDEYGGFVVKDTVAGVCLPIFLGSALRTIEFKVIGDKYSIKKNSI